MNHRVAGSVTASAFTLAGVLLASLLAWAGTKTATSPRASAPAPVVLTPRGWERSIYSLDGRFHTSIRDVTFEAPPAYQQSFAFWTGRMKGGQRSELIHLITTTREPTEDGSLPFHRQVSRYQLEMYEQGQMKVPEGALVRGITSLAWEGALDASGNVRDVRLVHQPEGLKDNDRLGVQLFGQLFPRLADRREMKVGETLTDAVAMPMPQRLSITGLEAVGVLTSRRLTLREVRGAQAIFDLAVSYTADPATPPTAPRTILTIGGEGNGEAAFDLSDGLFIRAKLTSVLVIDIEAPLRRLPDQPEDIDPGTAKSHIEMSLGISAQQSLAKLFDGASGSPQAEPQD